MYFYLSAKNQMSNTFDASTNFQIWLYQTNKYTKWHFWFVIEILIYKRYKGNTTYYTGSLHPYGEVYVFNLLNCILPGKLFLSSIKLCEDFAKAFLHIYFDYRSQGIAITRIIRRYHYPVCITTWSYRRSIKQQGVDKIDLTLLQFQLF